MKKLFLGLIACASFGVIAGCAETADREGSAVPITGEVNL